VNETHEPGLRSWVASAQASGCDFPIQNLPLGVFRRHGSDESLRGAVAIGNQLIDLGALHGAGLFEGSAAAALAACTEPCLNRFMGLGQRAWSALRLSLSRALRDGSPLAGRLADCLLPQSAAELALPAQIGDYTDFYSSLHHATRVGKLFRPDHPLLPNYKWVPIGYHGRSSSIMISGSAFQRPIGQRLPAGANEPSMGPSTRLDYEAEFGVFIGTGNALGEPVQLDAAEGHIFGLCLLNDWSARDLQSWEGQPLGPFLSKSFATTLSPWIVSLEALEPFRVAWQRDAADPAPLAYLDSAQNRDRGAFDIQIEARLSTRAMREKGRAPERLGRASLRDMYWTLAQLVAHHTINGCNLRPGDLLGTGTVSGPSLEEAGCLLELSEGGKRPLLVGKENRTFLEDGDTLELYAFCEREGAARIGFGSVVGTVLPAREDAPDDTEVQRRGA
jgi:fumarylacetoacetase